MSKRYIFRITRKDLKMILQYYMLRGDEYPPLRANPSDAGLDLRWTPTEESETVLSIGPGETVLRPNRMCIWNSARLHDGR
jgi:hypothetical protein